MTDTFKRLAQGQIAATAAAIYTVPASTSTIIKGVRITNADTGASHYFTLYDGGTTAANQILGQTTLQPNETFIDDTSYTMAAAGTIQAVADTASKLTYTIYGMEIT